MYTLVTRNEKNFDERGLERGFRTRQEAIDAADWFMVNATCAGASAMIFNEHGYTEAEITKLKREVRCGECGFMKCERVNGFCRTR